MASSAGTPPEVGGEPGGTSRMEAGGSVEPGWRTRPPDTVRTAGAGCAGPCRLLDLTGECIGTEPIGPVMSSLFRCVSLTALLAAVPLAFTAAVIAVPLLLVVSYYCWRKGDLWPRRRSAPPTGVDPADAPWSASPGLLSPHRSTCRAAASWLRGSPGQGPRPGGRSRWSWSRCGSLLTPMASPLVSRRAGEVVFGPSGWGDSGGSGSDGELTAPGETPGVRRRDESPVTAVGLPSSLFPRWHRVRVGSSSRC